MRQIFGIVFSCLLFVGCTSAPDGTGGPLDRVAPQSEYFAREKSEVFSALVEVLKNKGYTISRQAAAQGILEGEGQLLEGSEIGSSRQFLFTARLRVAGENVTGIELLMREAEEGDFKTGAVSASLRNHGRYEGIFEALENRLGPGTWMPPTASTR